MNTQDDDVIADILCEDCDHWKPFKEDHEAGPCPKQHRIMSAWETCEDSTPKFKFKVVRRRM